MKQFWTVFRFTYLDAVRKKSFIITTAILLVLVLAVSLLPSILSGGDSTGEDAVSENGPSVYYVDAENAIPTGREALAACGYDVWDAEDIEIARESVKNGEIDALIEIQAGTRPSVCITVTDFMSAPDTGAIQTILSRAWASDALAGRGLEDEWIEACLTPLPCSTEAVGSMNVVSYALGIVLSLIMFFCVYFYGLGVANSISTEKTSRVMETLVVSAQPKRILAGKCAAMGAVGLTQLSALILFAVGAFSLFVPEGATLFGLELSFAGLSWSTAVLCVVYFLMGYALYAMMDAVCGASVSRIEDVSNALMPVSMIAMLSFYVGYFTSILNNVSPLINAIAIYVPFCSPFAMPTRIVNGAVGAAEIAGSLGILAVSIVVVSWFSARLYASSVLRYGKRLKLKDMMKDL